MIEFSKIVIEGFGSFSEPVAFNLDRRGVVMVYGTNGNGKTTLFSALAWALYKINLKEVATEDVVTWPQARTDKFRGTRVLLEFFHGEDSYLIARHINFKGTTMKLKADSKLMIFKNAELVTEGQHKGDMNKYIEGLLGMDSNTFLNSILFGQRMKRLVEAPNDEKRELFENLFSLGFIAKAKEKAAIEISYKNKNIGEIQTEIAKNETTGKNLVERITEGLKLLTEFDENIKRRVEDLTDELTTCKAEIKQKEKTLSSYQEELKTFEEVDLAEKKEGTLLSEKSEELRKLGMVQLDILRRFNDTAGECRKAEKHCQVLQAQLDNFNEECPTCAQKIPQDKIKAAKSAIQKSLKAEQEVFNKMNLDTSTLKTAVDKIKAEYTELESSVKVLRQKVSEPRNGRPIELKEKIAGLNATIQHQQKALITIPEKIAKVKAEKKPDINIKEMQAKVNILVQEVSILNETLELETQTRDRLNWWNIKGFGAGGLKAFVFNAMLIQLNIYVEKYAKRLGTIVKFSVDLSKANKPFVTTCLKDGIEINYKALSGGEKQRVDICLAFAMHDLISHTAAMNILIMDEVFEGLDAEGREVVFEFVRGKASQGKTVYVVSHSDLIDSMNTKSVYVGKDAEFSPSYIQ